MRIFEAFGPTENDILNRLKKIYSVVETYKNFSNPSDALKLFYNDAITDLEEMQNDLTWWKLRNKEIEDIHNKILVLL